MNDSPCLLCTSPVPESREDANFAYLAGFSDGMVMQARGERRSPLCAEHSERLEQLAASYGLTVDGKELPRRSIPAANGITAFMHCAKCMQQLPKGVSPREWARVECGFTELGFQARCVRHNLNILHIDFQGHRHPANEAGKDELKLAPVSH